MTGGFPFVCWVVVVHARSRVGCVRLDLAHRRHEREVRARPLDLGTVSSLQVSIDDPTSVGTNVRR